MTSFSSFIMTARGRRWIYAISVAAIAVLVTYGRITSDQAPVWLTLIATGLGIAGPATALGHVTPDAPPEPPAEPSEGSERIDG